MTLGILISVCLSYGPVFVTGCHSSTTRKSETTSQAKLTKDEVLAIARKEVERRGWQNFEADKASFESGRWTVLVWRIPKVPGGHALIYISDDGKVLEFIPGA